MIPVRAHHAHRSIPLVTYTIVALNVIVFLWDRHGHPFGGSVTFSDLAMRPHEVMLALHGTDRFAWVTIFTSMFMHANLVHIAGNMIFLMVFGQSVEFALGPIRFTLYYLMWGVVAALAQVAVDPTTMTPTLGASGAIGGILGCYLLLFPSSKIEIIVPILAFLAFEVSAWILLGLWFIYQVVARQDGVANWAHVGGFLAGMVTVLIMGGEPRSLKAESVSWNPRCTLDRSPRYHLNPPNLPKFLLPCIALTAILSLIAVADRHRVETRNRSVSIAAEYETIESLAASQGITVDAALKSLYRNGLRSVVLTEETAGELIAEGRLSVRYAATPGGGVGTAPIVSGAPDDMKRLLRGNSIRYGAFSDPVQVGEADEQFPKLTPGMLRALPLGIDPDAAKRVRDVADFFHDQKNFQVIARMGNPVGISPKGVTETVGWAAEQGAKVYCPIGDQVLGRRDGKNALIDALKTHGMLYASPEFAKIGGDEQILQAAPELIVRLHAAQAAELDKLPPVEAVDRYA